MNRPWTDHYPEGVDHQMPEITHRSLAHMLEDACKTHGRAVAVECLGSNYSFADLDRRSTDFAAYLQGIGLQEGDRVAVMLPNVGQFPIVSLAVLRATVSSCYLIYPFLLGFAYGIEDSDELSSDCDYDDFVWFSSAPEPLCEGFQNRVVRAGDESCLEHDVS